jgi:hypothetical protein
MLSPNIFFSRVDYSSLPYTVVYGVVMQYLDWVKEYVTYVTCVDDTYAGALYPVLSEKERVERDIAILTQELGTFLGLLKGEVSPEDKNYIPPAIRKGDREAPLTAPPDVVEEYKSDPRDGRSDIKVTGLSGVSPQPSVSRSLRNLGTWKHSKDREVQRDNQSRRINRETMKMISRIKVLRCPCGRVHVTPCKSTCNDKYAIRAYYCSKCNMTYLAVYNLTEIRKCANGTRGEISPRILKDIPLVPGELRETMELTKTTLTVCGVDLNWEQLMRT